MDQVYQWNQNNLLSYFSSLEELLNAMAVNLLSVEVIQTWWILLPGKWLRVTFLYSFGTLFSWRFCFDIWYLSLTIYIYRHIHTWFCYNGRRIPLHNGKHSAADRFAELHASDCCNELSLLHSRQLCSLQKTYSHCSRLIFIITHQIYLIVHIGQL